MYELKLLFRHSSNPPPLHEGEIKFFENGHNGEFLLQMGGGSQEWGEGVGFIMGGWEIFKVSLHSWQRGANPLIL